MEKLSEKLSVPVSNFDVTGVIEQGCEFTGKLCFRGTVRINGLFSGEVYTPDVLVVGENARVEGNINAGVVIINGHVKGSVNAKHRVEIHRPAVFKGEIITQSLSVDEGVIFEGKSRMVNALDAQSENPSKP